MALKPNIHQLLTEDVINLLNKVNIFTVIDFVKEDPYKLALKTYLDREQITTIKNDFVQLLSPYKGFGFEKKLFKTGIDSFDELLGGGLKSGNLYDFCGLSATGKTQICNSIAVNLAKNYDYGTLYVDAKRDFSGQRIYNMLNARNCSDIECGVIMNSIRCESIYDVHQFLNILRNLPAYLDEHSKAKCLVVDSLPSLWFPLMDVDGNGMDLLCKATMLMHKIAFTHDMIILLTNIVTRKTESDLDTAGESDRFKTTTTVAMGKYWRSVPRQRFLLERPDVSNTRSTGERSITIVKGDGMGKTCNIHITNKGVV